jgi:CheY-like chemotaxis protein
VNIAIIDDSLFMRRLIRASFLEIHPEAKISEFSDATRALAELPALNPSLITLDMLMPGMNGLSFLAELRKTTPQPTPHILVITADIQKSIRQKCLELGVKGFIEKPINPDKLKQALQLELIA